MSYSASRRQFIQFRGFWTTFFTLTDGEIRPVISCPSKLVQTTGYFENPKKPISMMLPLIHPRSIENWKMIWFIWMTSKSLDFDAKLTDLYYIISKEHPHFSTLNSNQYFFSLFWLALFCQLVMSHRHHHLVDNLVYVYKFDDLHQKQQFVSKIFEAHTETLHSNLSPWIIT